MLDIHDTFATEFGIKFNNINSVKPLELVADNAECSSLMLAVAAEIQYTLSLLHSTWLFKLEKRSHCLLVI